MSVRQNLSQPCSTAKLKKASIPLWAAINFSGEFRPKPYRSIHSGMNMTLFHRILWTAVVAAVSSGFTAFAQMPGGAGGVNSAMIKLFGDNAAFTARADIQVLNSNRVEWMRMPSSFTVAEGKIRVDIDMTQMRSSAVTPATISTFKQLGMDQVTSVIRPDKKAIYIIYPRAASLVNMPLSEEDLQIANEKVTRTAISRETIDGHPCVKNKSVVKSSKGATLVEAVTWNATDLKDFPVQIETKEGLNTSIMHFQQINLTKPEAKLFEPPAGLKQYNNPQDLLTDAMDKAKGVTKPASPQPGNTKPVPKK